MYFTLWDTNLTVWNREIIKQKKRIRTCPENFIARPSTQKKAPGSTATWSFCIKYKKEFFNDVSKVPDSVSPSPCGAGNAE